MVLGDFTAGGGCGGFLLGFRVWWWVFAGESTRVVVVFLCFPWWLVVRLQWL
jgi:hypothetical protein